jgi:hypothetical protein
MVSFTPLPFYPRRNSLRYQLYRTLDGSELHGKEKGLLPLRGIEPLFLGRPAHIPVAIPAELKVMVERQGYESRLSSLEGLENP